MDPSRREPSHALALGVLGALSIPLLALGLGDYGLVDGDEGFYHYVARHMVETGDWTRLVFAGESRFYDTFTHAPLFFWLKAVVIAGLGDDYWSMRLASAVFAALSFAATYGLACRLVDRRFALLAAVLHATTFQFVYLHSGRTGEMEPLIACAMTLAVWTFLRGVEDRRSFAPHHVALVALLWLKAALLLIPLLAQAIYFALDTGARGRLRALLRDALWVWPIGLAWHVFQLLRDVPGFVETLGKLAAQAGGGAIPHHGLLGNLDYYALTLFWGGFPHALLYPLGLWALLRGRSEPAARATLLLVGVVLAYFCAIALRQPWYVNPLYAFLSIGVARWLSDLRDQAPRWALPATAASLVFAAATRIAFDTNPFALRSTQLRERVAWSDVLPPEHALWAFAAAVVVALLLLRVPRTPRLVPGLLALGLLVPAGLRVALPLRHTDTVTPIERLARDLAERRARGEAIDYPIRLQNWGELRLRYFFADDYVLETLSKPVPSGGRRVVHQLRGERRADAAGP